MVEWIRTYRSQLETVFENFEKLYLSSPQETSAHLDRSAPEDREHWIRRVEELKTSTNGFLKRVLEENEKNIEDLQTELARIHGAYEELQSRMERMSGEMRSGVSSVEKFSEELRKKEEELEELRLAWKVWLKKKA